MSVGKRYKFLGSTFQVQTGLSATKAITGVTRASPGVVTSAAHGLTLGAAAMISSVVGMTELNTKVFIVDNPDTNTFQLANTDTSGYGAYTSGGTIAAVVFSAFCELTGVNQQDGTADQDEVTTICSTAKEFEQGLADSGTLQLDYNFAPNEATQAALRASKLNGTQLVFKVILPGAGGTVLMVGAVQQNSFQGSVSDPVWKGSMTAKLTGPIYVLASS